MSTVGLPSRRACLAETPCDAEGLECKFCMWKTELLLNDKMGPTWRFLVVHSNVVIHSWSFWTDGSYCVLSELVGQELVLRTDDKQRVTGFALRLNDHWMAINYFAAVSIVLELCIRSMM